MLSRIFRKSFCGVSVFFAMVCGLVQPIFAAADGGEQQPDWVLPYFLIAVFLGLSLTILLRPSKRRNTAFTDAELNAQREQAMKEMKGHK